MIDQTFLILLLSQKCGLVLSWKRVQGASGKLQGKNKTGKTISDILTTPPHHYYSPSSNWPLPNGVPATKQSCCGPRRCMLGRPVWKVGGWTEGCEEHVACRGFRLRGREREKEEPEVFFFFCLWLDCLISKHTTSSCFLNLKPVPIPSLFVPSPSRVHHTDCSKHNRHLSKAHDWLSYLLLHLLLPL